MKKKFILFAILIVTAMIIVLIWRSTDQLRAKKFGGTMKVNIEQGHKLVNVTWKENDLWILSRPIKEGEVIEVEPYVFQQKTSFGIKEGKVEIFEQTLD